MLIGYNICLNTSVASDILPDFASFILAFETEVCFLGWFPAEPGVAGRIASFAGLSLTLPLPESPAAFIPDLRAKTALWS